jgi:crotonobetaine/carnitine-CoA ligase
MTVATAPEARTLPALLRARAEQSPDATFVVDELGTLSWAGAVDLARGTCAAFAALGVGRGDTVALMLDNRREMLAGWFGLAWMGAVEVPVNPAIAGDRLVHMLNHSGCRELLVQGDYLRQVDAVAGRLTSLRRVIVVGEGRSEHFETLAFAELDADPGAAPDVAVRFSDPEAVLFTSGSSGPAKGAVVSHGQHWTNGRQPTALFGIDERDTVYVCLPLHHNMAQGYGVCVSLVSGAAVRIAPRFDAEGFWDDVRAHGATVLSFVGAMLVLLAKRPPSEDDADNPLRVGFGVPIPADLHEDFERRFGVRLVHGYGSTEATIVAWNNREDRKVGAAGRPLPEFEVQVVDDDDLPLPAGSIGEICVRPREPFSMFSGYLGDAERTVEAWRNLWFHTGDRGWFDDDGDLWFSDRIGDVIRRMGEFISSQEVEEALLSHPGVQLAAAFGVPSELSEEELMVAVVPQPDAELDASAIRAWCTDRVPRHAVPRYVELREELPMTPTGKIEKYKLRERGVTAATDDARAGAGVSR